MGAYNWLIIHKIPIKFVVKITFLNSIVQGQFHIWGVEHRKHCVLGKKLDQNQEVWGDGLSTADHSGYKLSAYALAILLHIYNSLINMRYLHILLHI
jgi:hypothetical protein